MIRQQKVPLPEKTVNHNKREWLKKPANRRPATWSHDIALSDISEKAAKFCCRLHCMHLAGLRKILSELQVHDKSLVLSTDQRAVLRERFDVPEGKPWNDRFKKDLERWTPDFIYKLGIFRRVWDPAPPTIDWASSMTWLTMNQAEIPEGTLPMNYFLYTLCALELCSNSRSLEDTGSARPSGQPVSFDLNAPLTDWQQRTLHNAALYLDTARPLLSQPDINQLRLLVNHEPNQLFARAADCSATIHETLLGWGIQL